MMWLPGEWVHVILLTRLLRQEKKRLRREGGCLVEMASTFEGSSMAWELLIA